MGVTAFDQAVMSFFQQHFHNQVTDAVFPVITYLGEAGAFWIALTLILLLFKKTRRCAVCMAAALALGFLLGELGLKNIVCRPRPFAAALPDGGPAFGELLIAAPKGYSFPSGHTCSSFAAATVLLAHFKKWGVPALILAALIGFSRVFLFVHWPTDVLAGMALGVGAALFVLWAAPKIAERRRKDLEELEE